MPITMFMRKCTGFLKICKACSKFAVECPMSNNALANLLPSGAKRETRIRQPYREVNKQNIHCNNFQSRWAALRNIYRLIQFEVMSATNLFSRCANLTSYLQTLSSSQVMALYEHPATCLAIYRWAKFWLYEILGFEFELHCTMGPW